MCLCDPHRAVHPDHCHANQGPWPSVSFYKSVFCKPRITCEGVNTVHVTFSVWWEKTNSIIFHVFIESICLFLSFSCILHQQRIISSVISSYQPQLSCQYTQERSPWSRTCPGSPSGPQCAKHSTCSHHCSNKNKQRPLADGGSPGITFLHPLSPFWSLHFIVFDFKLLWWRDVRYWVLGRYPICRC